MVDENKDIKITPPEDTKPSLTEDQISTLVESKAQEKADEIATSKVEKLKEELAESLSGKKTSGRYGANGPESWDKLHDSITNDAVKIAEEKIEKRLEQERKVQEDKQKQTQAQVEAAQRAEYARMSSEWAEAVTDGILPDIGKEVKAKLKSGVKYEALSEDEQKDPGLRAYNETRLLHIKLKNEGKSNSFYRTASQFYRKQPAGARAPVMGGGPASPGSSDDDFDYKEIQANRKKKFGF
jgi:hypothetical protein